MPKLSEQVAELEELKEREEERTDQISYQERRIKDLQEQIAMLQRTLGKVRDDLEVRHKKIQDLTLDLTELEWSHANWKSALLLALAVAVILGLPLAFNIGQHYGVCP